MGKSVTRFQTVRRYLTGLLAMAPLMVGADMATVTIKVTVVVPPPCIVNGDRPIEVDFGQVVTTRVDGSHYRMPVNYSLSCKGASSNAIRLQIKGTGASFDSTVLQTNKAGLGVELQQGDRKLSVNRWLNFTYPTVPALWAVPVKQSGAMLKGGEFTAGATMTVAYQ